MNRIAHKLQNQARRRYRVRTIVSGTADRPRLTVHISHLNIVIQIIDDTAQKTLAYVTTVGRKDIGSTLTEKASWAGGEIAKKAKAAKIQRVVFDRNGRLYHGRLKALAEAARNAGLEF